MNTPLIVAQSIAHRRWLALLLFGLLLGSSILLSPKSSMAAGRDLDTVNISADNQAYDEKKAESHFWGKVDVHYKDFQIQSKEGTLKMTPAGEPSLATFFPKPHARRVNVKNGRKDDLDGDVMEIELERGYLIAVGATTSHVTSMSDDPVHIKADRQIFDNVSKTVRADGNVIVDYKETHTTSPQATLWVGTDGNAERVVFNGGTVMTQNDGKIESDKLTVLVATGNMTAETNVRSVVSGKDTASGQPVRVLSDYQQYDKANGKVLASGNVRIYYEDYIATGPKATFKLNNGAIDAIVLTGRGTIVTNGRKVTADRITINTNPKHFDAEGNVKSQFLAKDKTQPTPAASAPAAKPAAAAKKPEAAAPSSSDTPIKDEYLD